MRTRYRPYKGYSKQYLLIMREKYVAGLERSEKQEYKNENQRKARLALMRWYIQRVDDELKFLDQSLEK